MSSRHLILKSLIESLKHIKGNLNQGRDKIEPRHVIWTSNALYTLSLFWLPDYLNEWILGNLKFLGCGGYNNTATFQGFSVIRPIIWIYKAPSDFFCHFDKNAIKLSFCAALFCVIICYDTTVSVIIMMMIIEVIKCLVCNKYMITATTYWFLNNISSNISNMRRSVSSPDETPRRELKIRRAATSRCFIWWWNTVSNVWYFFSNKIIFEGEIKDANTEQFFIRFPNTH